MKPLPLLVLLLYNINTGGNINMKKRLLVFLVLTLFFGVVVSSEDVSAETPDLQTEIVGFTEDFEPYAVYTISQIIVFITSVCIQHCDKISVWANNMYRSGGLGKMGLSKNLWVSYRNWYKSSSNKSPISKNKTWNDKQDCIPDGNVMMCPMFSFS